MIGSLTVAFLLPSTTSLSATSMSSKHQKLKDAAKDAAKSMAHLVGVPVDRMSKKIEEIAEAFNEGLLQLFRELSAYV